MSGFLGEELHEDIQALPAVDAVEVRHGEWLFHPCKLCREIDICSACGTGVHRRAYGLNQNRAEYVTEWEYKYCPHCGAQMMGGNDDSL